MQNFFADLFKLIIDPRTTCSDGTSTTMCEGCGESCLANCKDTFDGLCTTTLQGGANCLRCELSCSKECIGICTGSCGALMLK